jgi:E-phenylitaconyl-CoA hydratase/naphthyl-2-hydroxymethylsuccinyl-CoA hydratase
MADTVLLEVRDRVAYVTLNRPEKLNAVNYAMIGDLFEVFDEVKDNPEIWVVLLTGAGRAFSTGHDLVMGRKEREDGAKPPRGDTDDLYVYLSRIWKPIIAAVNGYCLAQGGGLALLSDIRIASETAKFGWPQVKRGIASISGPTILSQYVPLGSALKLLFTGELCDAQEAYRMGLVQEVLPPDKLMERANEIARGIAQNSAPLAVSAIKQAAITGLAIGDFAERVANSRLAMLEMGETEDKQEGLDAFAEKRKPVFKGR